MRSSFLLVGFLAVSAQPFTIEPIQAQEATSASAAAPQALPGPAAKVSHRKHTASLKRAERKAKPEAPAAAPIAPWAAVDPTRAGAAAAPETAAMPGVHHVVQPDQDRMSVGMKWNSSNDTGNQYSTQGVLNEVNHDLGAPNAIGTDAEMGLKLHF